MFTQESVFAQVTDGVTLCFYTSGEVAIRAVKGLSNPLTTTRGTTVRCTRHSFLSHLYDPDYKTNIQQFFKQGA